MPILPSHSNIMNDTDLKCGGFQGSCVVNAKPAMQKILQEQLSHGKVITQLSHITSSLSLFIV